MTNQTEQKLPNFKCGYVAIVGRPNVGKSTLLNNILAQKLSITSRKPQTTRHTILGIKTTALAQTIYVDTPGLHSDGKKAMNRMMNRAADSVVTDVDVVIFIIDAKHWKADDDYALTRLPGNTPVILAVNKIDTVTDKSALLPKLQTFSEQRAYHSVIPISARTGESVSILEEQVGKLLPDSVAMFPQDQITDRSERFLAAEIIREKLMRSLGQEIPYEITVEIEKYDTEENLTHISAIIWVGRKGQKGIIIGRGGQQLKKVGEKARLDIEQLIQNKVFLQLWVKVKQGWSDDIRALNSLGYGERD